MNWRCLFRGRHDFPHWREWPLVSVTETIDEFTTLKFIAFKKQCRCCGAFEYEGKRKAGDKDHVPAHEPVWEPPEIVRRNDSPLPRSAESSERVRFSGIGG